MRWVFSRLFFAAIIASVPTFSSANLADPIDIDLPEQSLSKSLIMLGKLSQSTILFPSEAVENLTVDAVKGQLEPLAVIKQFLSSTDLIYRQLNPSMLVITPRCQGNRCVNVDDLNAYNLHQYPDIEELIVRGMSVTGSRFREPGLNSFYSIEVITEAEIRLSGAATLSELLRFTPSIIGNSASTAISNGGNGMATATLRGLPATNTLVLINGQRTASNGLDGSTVDLNSIPLAMVSHIEILKDGAATTYGSDAIAGVINVILKSELYGTYLNFYSGASSRSDNQSSRYDLIAGNSFGDLQLLFAASSYEQKGYFSRDREISENADGRPLGGVDNRSSGTANGWFTLDGDDFLTLDTANQTGNGDQPSDFRPVNNSDLFNYSALTSSLTPTKRQSLFFRTSYIPSSSLDWTVDMHYVDSESTITLAPTPVFTAFEQRPLTLAADNRYNPFGQNITDIRKRFIELGNRFQTNQSNTVRLTSTLLGSGIESDWRFNLHWSKTSSDQTLENLVNAKHLENGLKSESDCAQIAGCVPINLLGKSGSITPDQLAYLRAKSSASGDADLFSASFEFSTQIAFSPAGPLSFLAGGEIRTESIDIRSDTDNTRHIGGASIGNAEGSRDIMELYSEVHMPILKDVLATKILETSLSVRASDYSDFGTRLNPKVGIRYQPNDDFVFRGTASTSFRAPSLYELYQLSATSQQFLVDPCSTDQYHLFQGCSVKTDPLRLQYLTLQGGNEGLSPEKSFHRSIGVVYQPKVSNQLRISADWFRIKATNMINSNSQLIVDTNAKTGSFSQRVTRDSFGEITSIDATLVNLGDRMVNGVDFEAHWRQSLRRFGMINLSLNTAYIRRYEVTELDRRIDVAGRFADAASDGNGTIPRFKSRFDLLWQINRWELGTSSLYISPLSERISSENRVREIGSWLRQDMQINYRFNSDSSLITVGIENLFDRQPPFSATAFNDNFDVRTYDSIGRFYYAKISYRL